MVEITVITIIQDYCVTVPGSDTDSLLFFVTPVFLVVHVPGTPFSSYFVSVPHSSPSTPSLVLRQVRHPAPAPITP